MKKVELKLKLQELDKTLEQLQKNGNVASKENLQDIEFVLEEMRKYTNELLIWNEN